MDISGGIVPLCSWYTGCAVPTPCCCLNRWMGKYQQNRVLLDRFGKAFAVQHVVDFDVFHFFLLFLDLLELMDELFVLGLREVAHDTPDDPAEFVERVLANGLGKVFAMLRD